MAEYSKENKFYLQLNKDFFDQHYIKILETYPNGDKYVLFLVKLMAESISHNGYLRFNESIPYDEQMLSVITHTDIDVVRTALDVFSKLGVVEYTEDRTLFIPCVPALTISRTRGAEKKALQRAKKDTMSPLCPPNVHQSNSKSNSYSNSQSHSHSQSNSNSKGDTDNELF